MDQDDRAMTRDEALKLLHEFTESESLRKHAYAVEAAKVPDQERARVANTSQCYMDVGALASNQKLDRLPFHSTDASYPPASADRRRSSG